MTQSANRERQGWTIFEWHSAYRQGTLRPSVLRTWLTEPAEQDVAWISRTASSGIEAQLAMLEQRLRSVGGDIARLPLYGVPFAVKDNIDVAGMQTTAACPNFAYEAREDAAVVARLRAAGAILVGKTNLDQFATGLAGNRSPYGAVPCPFDSRYIAGGSSSGSASVVSRGLVPFALGTDTAGSGRVPAGFNNLVGLKPTLGRLSTRGVVPACRTLDCVSIFALTLPDAKIVLSVLEGFDGRDPYSRQRPESPHEGPLEAEVFASPHLCVPEELEFFGDEQAEAAFSRGLALLEAQGARIQRIDFAPFRKLACLLYEGPWIAERYLVVRDLLRADPGAIHPAVRQLVERAEEFTAADGFAAQYARADLTRRVHELLADYDALVVPTAPRFYTLEEVEAEPLDVVTRLGFYTNFANLGDLCALALPGPFRSDGLPAGMTLLAPAWHDARLLALGQRWEGVLNEKLGATGRSRRGVLQRQGNRLEGAEPEKGAEEAPEAPIVLAVVGAHLRGMPLNHQLTERGARFLGTQATAPFYRLFALAGTQPPKPGLVRAASGTAVELELWSMSLGQFGSFVAQVPPPLSIGTLELADGRWVKGFLCEPHALEGAFDITAYGGWKAYLARGADSLAETKIEKAFVE